MDKTKLINAEKDFYIKHFDGKQNRKVEKLTPTKKGELTAAAEPIRASLRRMLSDEGYRELVTHLKVEYKQKIAIKQGDTYLNGDVLKSYLAVMESDRSTKSAADEIDANKAEWIAGRLMANSRIVIEVTPTDELGKNTQPIENIMFVEGNIARSWYRDPDSGEAYTLDSVITANEGYSVMGEVKALLKANAEHIGSDYKGWRGRVPMANGVYDIKTGAFAPYDPDEIIPYRVELNYTPSDNPIGKPAELLDKAFLMRKPLIDIFCCFLGISLSTWQGSQRCFMGLGRGASNAKSTLIGLKQQVVGKKYVAVEQLSDIFSNGHGKTALEGKLVNICDDLNENAIRNQGDFNSLITSEMLRIEPKNVNSYYMPNWLTSWFYGNVIPRIGTAAGAAGVLRRLIIVPMDAHFSDEYDEDNYEEGTFMCDPDAINFIYEREELEALAGYCLKLLTMEYNERGSVINVNLPEVKEEIKVYYAELDSAFNYLDDNGYIAEPEKLHRQPIASVYEDYTTHVGSGGKPLSIKNFGKRLRNLISGIETTTYRGDKVYVYKGDK